jgi:hypothetical protein
VTVVRDVLRHHSTAIWALLMAATCLSAFLGSEDGASPAASRSGSVAILAIAFLKVRLVGLHFMELRQAPSALRLLFEGYVAVVCTLVVGFYLAT